MSLNKQTISISQVMETTSQVSNLLFEEAKDVALQVCRLLNAAVDTKKSGRKL